LREVTISHDLSKEQDTIVTEVNAARSLVRHPKLVIKHAKNDDIPMESLEEASKTVIKAKEDKKACLSLAIQQISYFHANFRKFMNEKNVLPFWILRHSLCAQDLTATPLLAERDRILLCLLSWLQQNRFLINKVCVVCVHFRFSQDNCDTMVNGTSTLATYTHFTLELYLQLSVAVIACMVDVT